MKDLRLFLALLLSLIVASAVLVTACGGDDDDDDDDNGDDDNGDDDSGDDDSGDDDDSSGGDAKGNCIDFMTDCQGVSQEQAETICSWVDQYDNLGLPCIDDVWGDYFDCLNDSIDCDNWDDAAAQNCSDAAVADIQDCF